MKNIILLLALGIVVSGCVTSAGSKVPGRNYAPTDPDSVQVLYDVPTRPFETVGHVDVQRAIFGADSANERKFRTVAATMGADAVIIDVIPKASYFGNYVPGKGRAIKWK